MNQDEAARLARTIVDANAYMTLATADAAGDPWASPVWFAHDRHTRYVWVSRPEARHSRNIADRENVGIVIFDSTVPIGTGQGVYIEATATVVDDADLADMISVFSARSESTGGRRWHAPDVEGESSFRLYVATARSHYVLALDDRRIPVEIG
jgi:general stress protein 26